MQNKLILYTPAILLVRKYNQIKRTSLNLKLYNRLSATDFLTTAILKQTQRAGVTAAAGTRLALFLLLVYVFKFISFQ